VVVTVVPRVVRTVVVDAVVAGTAVVVGRVFPLGYQELGHDAPSTMKSPVGVAAPESTSNPNDGAMIFTEAEPTACETTCKFQVDDEIVSAEPQVHEMTDPAVPP